MKKTKLAGCILLNPRSGILLLHRNTPTRQQWEIPGGKVEPGESSVQAGIRELKEELGIGVQMLRKLGHKEFTEDDNQLQYSWFLAKIASGKPQIMEPETFDDLQYFSLAELHSKHASLSPGIHNFLVMLEAGIISLTLEKYEKFQTQ